MHANAILNLQMGIERIRMLRSTVYGRRNTPRSTLLCELTGGWEYPLLNFYIFSLTGGRLNLAGPGFWPQVVFRNKMHKTRNFYLKIQTPPRVGREHPLPTLHPSRSLWPLDPAFQSTRTLHDHRTLFSKLRAGYKCILQWQNSEYQTVVVCTRQNRNRLL